MQDAGIAKAFENLQALSKDPKKRALYRAREMEILTHLNDNYVNRLEGIAEGKAEGALEKAMEGVRNLKTMGLKQKRL